MVGIPPMIAFLIAALKEAFSDSPLTLEFGKEELASDNAVGLGFLGRKISCQKTQ